MSIQRDWARVYDLFDTSCVADPHAIWDELPYANSTPPTSTVRVGTSFHFTVLTG